jgi:leader peptidase (prepilin peptidase)/N-methyltransferase
VNPVFAIIAFGFGLAFGSFLNVCIYRIPLALLDWPENIHVPAMRAMWLNIGAWRAVGKPERSFCPLCQSPINWHDNIPILGWLILRGHCRDCRGKISPRYAVVELLSGVLFVACYARFGLTPETIKFWVFSFLVLGLIFTDADHHLLPDAFTLPGFLVGLLFSLLIPMNDVATTYLPRFLNSSPSDTMLSFIDAAVGALAGAGFVYGAGAAYKLVRRREGMGLGDVKLMALIGAFLGLKLTLFTIFGASILGSIFGVGLILVFWGKRLRRYLQKKPARKAVGRAWQSAMVAFHYYAMPFGVFLGSMALFSLFFGEAILRWYLGLLRI